MTPWRWFAGELDDDVYSLACDCDSREAAIVEAVRQLKPGEKFRVVEARSSEDMRHEGADCVPFLRTRNAEVLTAGQMLVGSPITGEGGE